MINLLGLCLDSVIITLTYSNKRVCGVVDQWVSLVYIRHSKKS